MKVLLASVSYATPFTFHRKFLGLAYIHAHAVADPLLEGRVDITHAFYDIWFQDPEPIAERVLSASPDLVGFGCYVWNTPQILKIVAHLKRMNPRVLIVLGGPEMEHDPAGVLEQNPAVDFVAVGEGEETFKVLLHALLAGQDPEGVAGIMFRNGSGTQALIPRKPEKNLDVYESPYLAGVLEVDEKLKGAYFQTTRGCPFNCAYCDYGSCRFYSEFSFDRVKAEIEFFKAQGVERLFCVDATFNQNRKRAIRILNCMAERSLESSLWLEGRPDLLDEEFVEAVGRIHQAYLGLGLQTTNPESMKIINRRWSPERTGILLDRLAVNKTCLLGLELIMGLPGDDLEAFKKTLDWAYGREPSNVFAFPLQILPRTRLERERTQLEIQETGPGSCHEIISNCTFPSDQILVGKAMTMWNRQMQPVIYRLVKLTGLPAGGLIEEWAWYAYDTGLHEALPDLNRNRVDPGLLDRLAYFVERYCRRISEKEGLPDFSRRMREFTRYYYSRRAVTDEGVVFFDALDVHLISLDPAHNRVSRNGALSSESMPEGGRIETFEFDMVRLWPLETVEAYMDLEPEPHTYLFYTSERGGALVMEIEQSQGMKKAIKKAKVSASIHTFLELPVQGDR